MGGCAQVISKYHLCKGLAHTLISVSTGCALNKKWQLSLGRKLQTEDIML